MRQTRRFICKLHQQTQTAATVRFPVRSLLLLDGGGDEISLRFRPAELGQPGIERFSNFWQIPFRVFRPERRRFALEIIHNGQARYSFYLAGDFPEFEDDSFIFGEPHAGTFFSFLLNVARNEWSDYLTATVLACPDHRETPEHVTLLEGGCLPRLSSGLHVIESGSFSVCVRACVCCLNVRVSITPPRRGPVDCKSCPVVVTAPGAASGTIRPPWKSSLERHHSRQARGEAQMRMLNSRLPTTAVVGSHCILLELPTCVCSKRCELSTAGSDPTPLLDWMQRNWKKKHAFSNLYSPIPVLFCIIASFSR